MKTLREFINDVRAFGYTRAELLQELGVDVRMGDYRNGLRKARLEALVAKKRYERMKQKQVYCERRKS